MNDISEMTWIEEHFYDQTLSKGLTIGENRGRLKGRSEMLNAAVDFMRSNGISSEQINSFESYFRNSDSKISLRSCFHKKPKSCSHRKKIENFCDGLKTARISLYNVMKTASETESARRHERNELDRRAFL